jgi:dephospho-CoA kinase
MLKVALTGGIATGKSYVLMRLGERGVPVIDADDVVHEMLGAGTATTRALAAQLGSEFLKSDGSEGVQRSVRATPNRSHHPPVCL